MNNGNFMKNIIGGKLTSYALLRYEILEKVGMQDKLLNT